MDQAEVVSIVGLEGLVTNSQAAWTVRQADMAIS
jgi:hypothetical protein